MPEVLTEMVSQLDDVLERDCFFVLEENFDEGFICLHEFGIGCLDLASIHLGLLLHPLASGGGLAHLAQSRLGLFLGHLSVLEIFFHNFSQTALGKLVKNHEEDVLGEGDHLISINVHFLEELELVRLQVFFSSLEERCVAPGRHHSEEVLV